MRRLSALLCAVALLVTFAPSVLAAAPANDEIPGATEVVLTDGAFTVTQDTTEATANASDPLKPPPYPEDQPSALAGTVWFSFTPAVSADLSVDVTASDYVPTLLMLHGATVVDVTSTYSAPVVVGGETYHFMIGDEVTSDGVGGTLRFSVAFVPANPVPVEIDLAVTGATIVDQYLVVEGTYTPVVGGCEWSPVLVVLASQKGKDPAAGSYVLQTVPMTWSVAMSSSQGPWKAGRTTIEMEFFCVAEPGNTADEPFTEVATIRIPRK